MKQLLKIAAGLSIAALSNAGRASAQDVLFAQEEGVSRMRVQLTGSVMGPAVKGAPYSGEEVSSSTQVLADGTNIHHESRTTVYRDSEGRIRRETPEQTTIMDPVAGVSYFLNSKTMTAQKAPMMMNYRTFHVVGDTAPGRTGSTLAMITKDGETSMVVNGNPVDSKQVAEAVAKAKQQGEAVTVTHDELGTNVPGEKVVMDRMMYKLDAERMALEKRVALEKGMTAGIRTDVPGKSEDLGKATMYGVEAEGTRVTSTIDTGAIGNDRPIKIVTERWYSRALQTVLSNKTTDPRMGETTFQLTNVRRDEPAAYLFQVPAGYTVSERK